MNLTQLGRYELIRVIGKGAMGLVYEGRDPNLDRRVAIKTISVENLSEQETAEYEVRFRTEARSAARLQHPNIVSIYDSDRDVDMAYLVLELVDGLDLKQHLDKGQRYTLEQTAALMNDLLSALDYAHRQGIVHRDIKPANLLIEASGRVKLTDFGVARIQDAGDATRTKGTLVGTLKYMAPEQLQGQRADARSDLFSAAVVLYQLLTGYRPFDGGTDYEVMQKIMAAPLEPASTFNLHLSPSIDAVLAKALDKAPAKRYATAQEFNQAFQAAVQAASDLTITPAARNRKPQQDGATWAATVSQPSGIPAATDAGASLPASTVTQEVELVYWKEIKDSADPAEFQAFLAKFPEGIYAELARKRLARLGNAGENSGAAPARKRKGWLPISLGAVVLVAVGIGIGYEEFSAPQKAATDSANIKLSSPVTPSAKTSPATSPVHAPAKAVAAASKAPTTVANTNANAAPPDPNRQCEGRVLLGYLTCIQDQCAQSKFAEHPVCVERRNEEQRSRATSP
jgi:serine/threonine-protein kinase